MNVVIVTSSRTTACLCFQADLDGDRFIEDLRCNVERPVAFDAILRVRTSTGMWSQNQGHHLQCC